MEIFPNISKELNWPNLRVLSKNIKAVRSKKAEFFAKNREDSNTDHHSISLVSRIDRNSALLSLATVTTVSFLYADYV